jgi:5-methylthioribose kinase
MAISNSANILVRRCAGRWTVAAILDWEFAFEGSVAYDIGNFPAIRATSNLAL